MTVRAARDRRASAAAKYRPDRVVTLLVAEAPPSAEERYFYFEEVYAHDSLFWETMKVLYQAQTRESPKRFYLERFKAEGYFLIDSLKDPLPAGASPVRLIASGANAIANEIRALAPTRVILIKAATYDALYATLVRSQLPIVDQRIPFPGAGQQTAFRSAFRLALHT